MCRMENGGFKDSTSEKKRGVVGLDSWECHGGSQWASNWSLTDEWDLVGGGYRQMQKPGGGTSNLGLEDGEWIQVGISG